MLDQYLDDVGTTTVYDGSGMCTGCGAVMDPVQVAYLGTRCPRCTRLAQQRLVANKRVGDL